MKNKILFSLCSYIHAHILWDEIFFSLFFFRLSFLKLLFYFIFFCFVLDILRHWLFNSLRATIEIKIYIQTHRKGSGLSDDDGIFLFFFSFLNFSSQTNKTHHNRERTICAGSFYHNHNDHSKNHFSKLNVLFSLFSFLFFLVLLPPPSCCYVHVT